MVDRDSIGKQVAEPSLRPAIEQPLRDHMEIGARIDPLSDARPDDGEDARDTFTAIVLPGKQPILSSENQSPELPFDLIVGQLDRAVLQEEAQPMPLPMKVPERAAERSLRRDDPSVLVEPCAELVDDRPAVHVATDQALLVRVAGARRSALDREELRDDPQGIERERLAGFCGVHEPPARMPEATRPPAASALEERGDARAVTLHRPAQDVAEERAHAARAAVR